MNKAEILQHNPELERLADNEQVNINHIGCPAGRDIKKRLFVRKKDGALLFYCHHCSEGAAKQGKKRYIRDRAAVQTSWALRLPTDLTRKDMHVAGRSWLYKSGITMDEARLYGIGWSESAGRVILPVYDLTGFMTAYQSRRVLPHDHMPKYLTDKDKAHRFPMFLANKQCASTTVVLTEDILSAIKVGRQCEAAAILGVHLSPANRNTLIAMGYERVVVWLDDDNPAVKAAQRKICKAIAPFADVVKVTGHTVDPKGMTDEQIKLVLQGYGVS